MNAKLIVGGSLISVIAAALAVYLLMSGGSGDFYLEATVQGDYKIVSSSLFHLTDSN
jgi:hypothetical protein